MKLVTVGNGGTTHGFVAQESFADGEWWAPFDVTVPAVAWALLQAKALGEYEAHPVVFIGVSEVDS